MLLRRGAAGAFVSLLACLDLLLAALPVHSQCALAAGVRSGLLATKQALGGHSLATPTDACEDIRLPWGTSPAQPVLSNCATSEPRCSVS